MKKIIIHILCSCTCLLCITINPVTAQQVFFNRVLPPDGSIFGTINGITQDQHGYMWLTASGTGLHRFDGYHLVTFSNDPKNPNSLSSNKAEEVYAGHNGIIWVGTETNGLDRFDPSRNLFIHFPHDANDSNSLSDNHVTAILEDRNGDIWVGTWNGLNRLDQKTRTIARYYHDPEDASSLSDNRVQVIYEDRQGTIWIGTGAQNPGKDIADDKGGLNRFNPKNENFTCYRHQPGDPNSLINNRVGAIFEDSRGYFWVNTAGTGLHTMNRHKGTFKQHIYDPLQPGKLSLPPPQENISQDLGLFFVREDGAGAIWAGGSGGWITRYDPATQNASHYDSFNGDAQFMGTVSGAFTSLEGVLWITTWLGNIYRVDPFGTTIGHYDTKCISHNIHEDNGGTVWIATFGSGLLCVNSNHETMRRVSKDLLGMNNLPFSSVDGIYEENDSILWFGSKNLYRYNRKNKVFRYYVHDPQNENSLSGEVTAIIGDQPGSLWIATGNGLDHFDFKTATFRHWRKDAANSNSLSSNGTTCITKDHAGNLWIGTQDTLNFFDAQKGTFRHFNCHGTICSIIEDFEHIIWVGTTTGLYRSNQVLDSFSRFTDPRIPMSSITMVPALVEDDEQNLWASSTAGIFRLSRDRTQISVYSRNQGVDPSTFSYPLMKASKGRHGELFFANSTGYYSVFPSQIKINKHPPQVVISDFKLEDQAVKPGKDAPLYKPITITEEINLRYNQHTFSFDFTGIHYTSPDDNKLFFMLENLDNDWKKAGVEKKAWYYNVPPGHYNFRVKAATKDGVWAEKAIAIVINPPWYNMWWAYMLYVATFVIIIWMFNWYRSRRLRAENILLEKKVINRTKELEQSLEEKYELGKKVESQQALLNERLRISRELHDDIGSTLGSISIYSEVAKKRNEKNENINEVLSKIGLASRELIDKMGDIVWSLNPGNEGFEQLQNRMTAFAGMILAPRNIHYVFCTDEALKKLQFTGEQRKNIFLIFKEALHNIVKYADCKTVNIKLAVQDNNITMTIKDDGKGFHAFNATTNEIISRSEYSGGNGIKNMLARAKDMDAKLCIESKINEGTTIQLALDL